MHPFRAAVESGELDNIGDLVAENAVLNSPVAHRPCHGRGMIAAIIAAAAGVLEAFRFRKGAHRRRRSRAAVQRHRGGTADPGLRLRADARGWPH